MALELLFLGTGTSAGVPMIGCECPVCRSPDPRDQRFRPSVLVSYPDAGDDGPVTRRLLIDATAELRLAAIRHGLRRLDAVLMTHAHADHVTGIDDLRRFNVVMGGPLDVYGDQPTHDALGKMFPYIFEPHRNLNKSFIPQLVRHTIRPAAPFVLHGARWTAIPLMHGRQPIVGYRVDLPAEVDGGPGAALAYCTDVSRFPPEAYPLLEGLDVLVIDALRYRHHPTHLTVDQALAQIGQIQPRHAYLTHMAHDVMHADLEASLPEHVFPSFDGLTVRCHPGGDIVHRNAVESHGDA